VRPSHFRECLIRDPLLLQPQALIFAQFKQTFEHIQPFFRQLTNLPRTNYRVSTHIVDLLRQRNILDRFVTRLTFVSNILQRLR
jgi:hypothetical protein